MPNIALDNTVSAIASLIDHAVLHPTNTLSDTVEACAMARSSGLAALCVKPCFVRATASALLGSPVATCAVTSFPHGNAPTAVKCHEIETALADGAVEIDTVMNHALVRAADWPAVAEELRALVAVTHARGALLKVIFETDFLTLEETATLARHCAEAGVDFVKTSTGFGYVKQANGDFNYAGATEAVIKIMLDEVNGRCGVKASAGIRTLDDLLRFRDLGCTRIGVGATVAILAEAEKRFGGNGSAIPAHPAYTAPEPSSEGY